MLFVSEKFNFFNFSVVASTGPKRAKIPADLLLFNNEPKAHYYQLYFLQLIFFQLDFTEQTLNCFNNKKK